MESPPTSQDAGQTGRISVVIPAHNEEAVIGRCLQNLLEGAEPDELEFVVVGNGCKDATATAARSFGPPVRVIETPVASKSNALNLGDAAAQIFPRAYIDADIRDTGKIVKDAASLLDFGRPVAVCLIMILQFIPDEDDPASIVRALVDAVPSGSYLTIAHPASDVDQYVGPALRQLSTRMGGTRAVPRSHQQVSSFFDGLDLVEPGVVQLHRWRPGSGVDDTGRDLAAYGAVARKP